MPVVLGYVAAAIGTYLGGSTAVAYMAYADPSLTAGEDTRSKRQGLRGTMRELCPHPYDLAYDRPGTTAILNGAEWRTYISEDVVPKTLFGPFHGVGHCLSPLLRPGGFVFADPSVPAFSGAIVLVYRPSAPPAIRLSLKILQHLLGRWWWATLDDNPPLSIIRGDTILGVVTASAHLPPDDPRTLEAERQSVVIEASIRVPDFVRVLHEPAARALMEKGPDSPRVPYPWPNAVLREERGDGSAAPIELELSADRLMMLEELTGVPTITAAATTRE